MPEVIKTVWFDRARKGVGKMAAGSLAMPGTPNGPCLQNCSHLDCIAARQIAVEICRLCHKQIGYDQPFYSEPDARVHAACLEEELTRKLKAGLPESDARFLTVEEVAILLRVPFATGFRRKGFPSGKPEGK
jgi:hypothetical protein